MELAQCLIYLGNAYLSKPGTVEKQVSSRQVNSATRTKSYIVSLKWFPLSSKEEAGKTAEAGQHQVRWHTPIILESGGWGGGGSELQG